jgi:hypothetical protein
LRPQIKTRLKIKITENNFQNGRVRVSENLLLHKSNEDPGENCHNQLFQNPGN